MKAQLSVLQELIALMDPQLYQHLEKTDSLNLFFCFRWILILFKREFRFEDCLAVWEAIWSSPCTKNFHLFIALSILESHRNVIIRYLKEFDEVLKYIVDLSGSMDPQPLLTQAEVLYIGFQNLVVATDRRQGERSSPHTEDTSLRKRNNATGSSKTPETLPATAGYGGLRRPSSSSSATSDKAKLKDDKLVQLVQDEAEAEARVPDIKLSKELRALAFD